MNNFNKKEIRNTALTAYKQKGPIFSKEELEKQVEHLDKMRVEEIESLGVDTQNDLNKAMSTILDESRVIDLGEAGDRLRELAVVTKSSKKALALRGPFATLTRLAGSYDKLENQMETLEENVDNTVSKLNKTLNNLSLNNDTLKKYVTALREKEESLTEYANVLEERNDPDQTRLQTTVRRLKDITTIRMMAEQNYISSVVNLQENKEAAKQIADIKTNIIPIIKMQLVNKISSKIAADAIAVKNEVYKYTNALMVEGVQDLDNTADQLIEARSSSAYDLESFDKACAQMIQTIEKVAKSAGLETEKNKEIIKRMKETAIKMNELVEKQFEGNE